MGSPRVASSSVTPSSLRTTGAEQLHHRLIAVAQSGAKDTHAALIDRVHVAAGIDEHLDDSARSAEVDGFVQVRSQAVPVDAEIRVCARLQEEGDVIGIVKISGPAEAIVHLIGRRIAARQDKAQARIGKLG